MRKRQRSTIRMRRGGLKIIAWLGIAGAAFPIILVEEDFRMPTIMAFVSVLGASGAGLSLEFRRRRNRRWWQQMFQQTDDLRATLMHLLSPRTSDPARSKTTELNQRQLESVVAELEQEFEAVALIGSALVLKKDGELYVRVLDPEELRYLQTHPSDMHDPSDLAVRLEHLWTTRQEQTPA